MQIRKLFCLVAVVVSKRCVFTRKSKQKWPSYFMTVKRIDLRKACLNRSVSHSNSQFHQHYTRTFLVQIFRQSQNVTRKSCGNDVRMKNSDVKCR